MNKYNVNLLISLGAGMLIVLVNKLFDFSLVSLVISLFIPLFVIMLNQLDILKELKN